MQRLSPRPTSSFDQRTFFLAHLLEPLRFLLLLNDQEDIGQLLETAERGYDTRHRPVRLR